MAKSSKKLRHLRRPKILWALITLVVLLLVVGSYAYYWHHKTPTDKVITKAGNLSNNVKKNVSSNVSAPKNPTTTTNAPTGNIVDTHGQSTSNTSSSDWITSTSGAITVKQPIANAKLQNGSVLSGSANVGSVCYSLIDNVSGVLATGSLSVDGGNFSGTLQFTPSSSSGRLDVFSTDTDCTTGVELNEIEIAVNF